jgi:hypothetical protein
VDPPLLPMHFSQSQPRKDKTSETRLFLSWECDGHVQSCPGEY